MSNDNPFLNDNDQPLTQNESEPENKAGHSVNEIKINLKLSGDSATPEKKVNNLKKAIADLGFKVEEGKNGEIKLK